MVEHMATKRFHPHSGMTPPAQAATRCGVLRFGTKSNHAVGKVILFQHIGLVAGRMFSE